MPASVGSVPCPRSGTTPAGRIAIISASVGAGHDGAAAELARRLDGGGTVLLHDSDCTSAPGAWHSALGALPRILDTCAERGLDVGRLGDHGWPSAP
ncbi:hypothetical protein ACWGLF_10910 [Streptomyces puniciscabiei]